MPRTPRAASEKQILHIINRGVERRPIFSGPADYNFFLTQTKEVLSKLKISLLSYCLMPNHFHLLVADLGGALSSGMQTLQSTYSMYFNRVYDRVGHLFQDRFKSFEVEDFDYLSWLPVYIHRNPIKAGLVTRPEQWEWSGHGELTASASRFLDLSGLHAFGIKPDDFKRRYSRWAEEFVRPLPPTATLQQMLEWCSMQNGVRWQDVRDGLRGGPHTQAKLLFLYRAQQRGFTVQDVAKTLGCAPSSLRELLSKAAQEKGHSL